MPIDYKKYPPNWPDLRKQVLERSGHKCEWPGCGIPNYQTGYRGLDGKWFSFEEIDDALHNTGYDHFDHELKHCYKNGLPTGPTKIILTVAHLDHDEENQEVKIDRLAAYCQYHHLRYDVDEKKRRRKLKKKQFELELK